MPGTLRFTLFGIPVAVQPIFWVVIGILGFPHRFDSQGFGSLLIWVPIVFVAIMIHELGHAFAMRRFGGRPGIELYGFGGLTHWHGGAGSLPRAKSIAVSLAGPAAGLLAGVAALPIDSSLGPETGWAARFAVHNWLWINIGWSLFNLLPVLPLDGGHTLEDILQPMKRGWVRARWFSIGVAAVGIVVGLAFRQWWISLVLAWCAGQCYYEIKGQMLWGGGTLRRPKTTTPKPSPARKKKKSWRAPKDPTLGVEHMDVDTADEILRAGQSADRVSQALTAVAFGSAKWQRDDWADLVERFYNRGEFAIAAKLSEACFDRFGRAYDAYNAACCLARSDSPHEGLRWLERAIDNGYDDPVTLDDDPDLAPLRALPEFAKIRAKVDG